MLEKLKISVRVNILTLFALLLMTVGITIACIDYFTTQRILLSASKKIIQQTSAVAEHLVSSMFLPGFFFADHSDDLIRRELLIPGSTKAFTIYLLEAILDMPHNSIIAWGEPSGNYYELERDKNNTFLHTIITCKKPICTAKLQYIDAKNKKISAVKTSSWNEITKKQISGNFTPYDPRVRPWYIQAITSHKPVLSDVFVSKFFTGDTPLCMNSANPVYSESGELMGVFSVKTNLQTLSKYIAAINLTKHSVIFVVDENRNLIAAKNLANYSAPTQPKIEALNMPWIVASYEIHQNKHGTVFTYSYNNIDYVAYYHKIPGLRDSDLDIAIVIPINDVIGFLNRQLLFSLLLVFLILGVSTLIVWFLSNAISKPIIKLADEFKQVTYSPNLGMSNIKSRIKEINYMQDAFNAMKRGIKSFTRYVPFTLVKQLFAQGSIAHVGGESKQLTCLFADVQGFTTMCEKLTPLQLMTYLSEYFDAMTKIIIKNNGTVDKYIGDGIMAFWGAPMEDNEHALHACKTALEMQHALKQLNQKWITKGHPEFIIRIGINSGNMVVGNVGSEDRLNYTILGDNVNLANRAEDINKRYGTNIIVTENTYQFVKNKFSFRFLDFVVLRGKTAGINIYELS